ALPDEYLKEDRVGGGRCRAGGNCNKSNAREYEGLSRGGGAQWQCGDATLRSGPSMDGADRTPHRLPASYLHGHLARPSEPRSAASALREKGRARHVGRREVDALYRPPSPRLPSLPPRAPHLRLAPELRPNQRLREFRERLPEPRVQRVLHRGEPRPWLPPLPRRVVDVPEPRRKPPQIRWLPR